MENTIQTAALDKLLDAAQLPALPHSAMSLLSLSQDTTNGPAQYAGPIEADPGLLSQVLKFVNSSYFGFSREIASVGQALTLVGVRTITNFALWSAVFSLVPNPKVGNFNLKQLWQDSLRRGLFARLLGKNLGVANYEDLFAGALLQDMAIPVLLKELQNDYVELVCQSSAQGVRLSTLERERFGWDHAQAAAQLATNWRLPAAIVSLIESHTRLDQLLAQGKAATPNACVALASLLPEGNDSVWQDRDEFIAGYRALGGDISGLKAMMSQIDESVESIAPMLKLPVPQLRLSELLSQ